MEPVYAVFCRIYNATFLMIQWFIDNQGLATLIFSAVVALSTVIYAVLTALLVSETARMRRAQTEPRLSAYFKPVEEHVNFGHLYIENIGLGPAFDIKLTIDSRGSIEGCKKLLNDFLKMKSFERGANYLGPGQILRSRFTSMTEDYEEKIQAVLSIRLDYKCADGTKKAETFIVNFAELEGYGTFGTPSLYAIAQSIEKIQKDIHHLATGFYKPKVQTFNNEDREREFQEWEARQKIELAKKGDDSGGGNV